MKNAAYLPMNTCLVALLVLGAVARAQELNSSNSTKAFEKLTSLVGVWTGVEFGQNVKVTYTLIGEGSALMEDTRPVSGASIEAMETMFSVNGDRLLATHYCDAKNQPQMASEPIIDPNPKSFAFSVVRVTGMKTAKDWHNTSVAITLEDKDHITQQWGYLSNGKAGINVFHLTRKSRS